MSITALCLCALSTHAPLGCAQDDEPTPALGLPDGPLSGLWERMRATPAPEQPVRGWPAPGDSLWEQAQPWTRWVETLERARGTDEAARTARAELALLAAQEGRPSAAWSHLGALLGTGAAQPQDASSRALPAAALAALPLLLPGVAPDHPLGVGGLPAPLPAGATLRPLLPPATPGLPAGAVDRRQMELSGFQVGGATLALRVAVEPDGVQIDVRHLAGEPTQLGIVIPCPPELEIRVEYAAWMRAETIGEPLVVEVSAEEPIVSLWGRALPRADAWPLALPDRLPTSVRAAGLVLEIGADDPERARLEQLAGALGQLFAVPGQVRTRGVWSVEGTLAPLVIHLPSGAQRARKLNSILELAERFALSPAFHAGEDAPR